MPVSRGQPDQPSPPAPQVLGLAQDGDEVEWETYAWEPEGELPARAPRGVGIRALARRLIASERAAAKHSGPQDPPARARDRHGRRPEAGR